MAQQEESRNRGETGSFKGSPIKNAVAGAATDGGDHESATASASNNNSNAFAESVIIRSGQRLVTNRGSSKRNLLY